MKSNYKIYQNCFDEEKVSKDLFEFNKNVRPVINELINKSGTIELFKLVMKYIYNNFTKDPEQILTYIKKYSVIISYNYTKQSNNDKFINNDLDEMLLTPLTKEKIEKEIQGEDFYATWFNQKDNYKDVNDTLNELYKEFPKLHTKIRDIRTIKSYEYNYFSPTTNLQRFYEKDRKKRFDMLLAEVIVSPEFSKFEFEIKEDQMDNFTKNVIIESTKQKNDIISFSYTLMGYIAHYFISNNSRKITFPFNSMYKSSYLKCVSMQRKASIKLTFMNKNDDTQPFTITPFDFIYNGKEYTFNESGINNK